MDPKTAALHFEARKYGFSQDKNGVILRLCLHPNECPPDLLNAALGTRYLVALVQLGDDEQPITSQTKPIANQSVATAGLLCRNERFQTWLVDQGYADAPPSEIGAANALRELLDITSRAELATNREALVIFENIVSEFENHIRGTPS